MNNEAPQIFDDEVLFIGAYFCDGERTIVHKAMLLHHSKDELDLQDFKEGVTEYLGIKMLFLNMYILINKVLKCLG